MVILKGIKKIELFLYFPALINYNESENRGNRGNRGSRGVLVTLNV